MLYAEIELRERALDKLGPDGRTFAFLEPLTETKVILSLFLDFWYLGIN